MKNLLVLSLLANVALAAALVWIRADYESQSQTRIRAMIDADEHYMDLLGLSLRAIESPGSEQAATAQSLIRQVVDVGLENRDGRRRAGARE